MDKLMIKNLDELSNFAKNLAASLRGGAVVALSGDLGAGKTALAQMTAKAWGVKTSVVSPTFTVFKIYSVAGQQFRQLCHIDLYRLDDFSRPHGFEEYIGEPNTACLIEWAEKIKNRLPAGTIWINLEILSDEARLVTVGGWS